MDELIALVYFLIFLNVAIILFMGYDKKNASYFEDDLPVSLENDNIFTRKT